MVDGHPYKVEVVGSSPTVPIHLGKSCDFENAES